MGGLIALLTPCVFPMIPVTVSFFTKKANTKRQAIRNGILYGFFIFLIYVFASIPFHVLGNVQPEIFNNISTNSWLNIIFFIIFIFSRSPSLAFEISLPGSIASKADSKKWIGQHWRYILHGAYTGHCFVLLYRPHPGLFAGRFSERRRLATDGRSCWLWPGAGIAVRIVCDIPQLVAIATQIGWLARYG